MAVDRPRLRRQIDLKNGDKPTWHIANMLGTHIANMPSSSLAVFLAEESQFLWRKFRYSSIARIA